MTQEELELSWNKLAWDRHCKLHCRISYEQYQHLRCLKKKAGSAVRLASATDKEEDRLAAAQAIDLCRAELEETLEKKAQSKNKKLNVASLRFAIVVVVAIAIGVIWGSIAMGR